MSEQEEQAATPRRFAPTLAPPAMRSVCGPGEVMERLRKASKRGNLAGFASRGADEFEASVFGAPFDRRLIGGVRPEGGGSIIAFTTQLDRKPIVIAWVVLVLTIWPGVLLTHSFLGGWAWYASQFSSWKATCLWYVPLCVLAVPALLGAQRKSDRAAAGEVVVVWEKIAGLVDGEAAG